MTSLELRNYFFEYIENLNQMGKGHDIGKDLQFCVVFAQDEYQLDERNLDLRIPKFGTLKRVEGPAIDEITKFEWMGIVETGSEGSWEVIFGNGNPYIIQPGHKLPQKNGIVLAIPASLIPDF